MSAGLARLFSRLTAGNPIAVRPSVGTAFRPNTFGLSPLTVYRAKATSSKAAASDVKPKATAKTTTASTTSTNSKKPKAATKVVPKKTVTAEKKAVPKKKAAPKKKIAPKKRVVTPEQKEKRKEALEKRKFLEMKQKMKAQALQPPCSPSPRCSGYNMYFSEIMKATTGFSKEEAVKWSLLPESEKNKYNQLAEVKLREMKAAYPAFIESLTLDQVKMANKARRWLKRHTNRKDVALLHDHRLPKKAITAYLAYYSQNYNSLSGIGLLEKTSAASQRWKEMTPQAKQRYIDLEATSKQRYQEEMRALNMVA